jgi:hypothetical protein
MELLGSCSELLVSFFSTHGMNAVYNDEEGTVSLPDYPPFRFALQVYESGPTIVDLEALFEWKPGHFMQEWLAGWGETQKEAIMDAQSNFVACVFHVWAAALVGKANPYAREFDWEINGAMRKVYTGFPAGRGDLTGVEESGWQDAWYQSVRDLPLSEDVHWLSLCYVHNGVAKEISCDALLDNEHNDLVRQRMLSHNWPRATKLYSIRQFMIVKPLS